MIVKGSPDTHWSALIVSNSKLSQKCTRSWNQKLIDKSTHIWFLVFRTVIMFMATYSDRKMFSLIYIKLTDVSSQSLGHFDTTVFYFSKVKKNFSTIFDNLERDIILNEYYVLDSVSRDFSFLIQDDMIWTEQLFWNFGNVFELQSTILKEVFKSLKVIPNISAF